ncbi:hypothetical protein Scep_025109 [Stephania cephalantha]|uniref:Nuclear pore complex protein NUP160 n=1 Tax=Stephania cephalantha TaxID=152367 RepID=A0AAP0EHK9_9MAGN
MVMGSLAGTEVPILGSDALKWLDLSVVPSSPPHHSSHQPFAPPTEDAASCHIIGDPPVYLFWRIHKKLPHVLELLEFSPRNDFPSVGLRLVFQDALCPFAFIWQDESRSSTGNPYFLYALTVSGIAYVFQLKNVCDYASCSTFPQNKFVGVNLQAITQAEAITAVAATKGCLLIGRPDGSINCFQLGTLDKDAPGFMHELRDDGGIGRIWSLMARGRSGVSPVQDLLISKVCGRKLLLALHLDGSLRGWDLSSHTRLFNHVISPRSSPGTKVSRLCVSDANSRSSSSIIPIGGLYRRDGRCGVVMIGICTLHFDLGDKITFSSEPLMLEIPLTESKVIDLKIVSEKLWILKENGLLLYDISLEKWQKDEFLMNYGLYEAFVADQLFQGSENSLDDLVWTNQALFSSMKGQVVPFVSSIFLRRLFQPGILQNIPLISTIKGYNKQCADTDFQSLTLHGLREEIFSVMECEGGSGNQTSVICWWKNFCHRYFCNWCKSNLPYSLFADTSTGAVGLVRQNSISLFRGLEDIEMLIYGSFDEIRDLDLPENDLDREILFELLRCASSISQQLGKAAAAIFCESRISAPVLSSEEIVPHLVKILETGCSSAVAEYHVSQFGSGNAWKKELSDHKNQRKFSVDMLLTLHTLYSKADSWAKVLDVLENYLKFLVPRKTNQIMESEVKFNVNTSIMVQSTSQIAKVMFESALDVLLLLGYLVNISGQVHMMQEDISRIQLELVPLIEEILTEWLILHFLGTTPCQSPSWEDFSSQLSSLHIDGNSDNRSWNGKPGFCNFPLACLLFVDRGCYGEDQAYLSSHSLPNPNDIVRSVRTFSSWIIWGLTHKEYASFFSHSTDLTVVLMKRGQYEAVENIGQNALEEVQDLLAVIDVYSRKEKTSQSVQSTNGEWCRHLHLLGLCLLARSRCGLQEKAKEKKVHEAVRCFFRASSCLGASQALQSLSIHGPLQSYFNGLASEATWKLHYYQWVMQMFELYNWSDGACEFALAALEQVDEVLDTGNDNSVGDLSHESATTIRGRLWANVFKFTLDLKLYYDAYCAIISNPDEESKYLCLRRFVIVLIEHGASKTLCNGGIPFVGLIEKVEQELAWKAERSDVAVTPSPYKLLYAFEMHRHNWRKAACYIYRYSVRLRGELVSKEQHRISLILQERLNGLSAAINALNLVHAAYAWIDPQFDNNIWQDGHYPNKKARKDGEEKLPSTTELKYWRANYFIDVDALEKEFVVTSAEYSLSIANNNFKVTEKESLPSELVDLLVKENLYDMAFTVILRFWAGSELERKLEQVFIAMSVKCCPNTVGSPLGGCEKLMCFRNSVITHRLLLTSAEDETSRAILQTKGSGQWGTLELYLEKYKSMHPRLPTIVAETLLRTDPQIELPLWLVRMFKGGRRATAWGMTGQESDPASLFRLYVNSGHFVEAINLLLEYMDSFASLKPANIINRKKMSAIWFPFTTIEMLWCQLGELSSSGHITDQCDKLKRLLRGALTNHLKQVEADSCDAVSSAIV